MLYMVTFTINLPPMLAYIPFMDPMGIYYIYIHPSTDLPRPKAPRRVQVPQEVTSLPKPRSSSSPGAPNFFAAAEVKWVW